MIKNYIIQLSVLTLNDAFASNTFNPLEFYLPTSKTIILYRQRIIPCNSSNGFTHLIKSAFMFTAMSLGHFGATLP